MRRRIATTLGVALLATMLVVPAAQASQEGVPVKNTPNPITAEVDLPGCRGNINATFNHDSSIQGHGRDSKGPGWFFNNEVTGHGQVFKAALAGARDFFCTENS